MLNLDRELKRARGEMLAGALDNALAILDSLRAELEKKSSTEFSSEEEKLHGLVRILNNLGVVQKNRGALDQAAKSLERALEIANKIEADTTGMTAGILSNLGLLYSRCKEYTKGLNALDEALELAIKYPDKVSRNLLTKLRNNRALFHVRFGEPDKAREELALSIEPIDEYEVPQKDVEREAWLTANLAMIHAELGEDEFYNPPKQDELYRQARSMLLHSAELYGEQGYKHHRLKQLVNAAEIDLRLHSPLEAKRHLSEAHREAVMLNDTGLLCEIAQVYVELALQLRNRKLIAGRVENALKLFYRTRPEDLTLRLARLEGVLARDGRTEALETLQGYKTSQNLKNLTPIQVPNRKSGKTTSSTNQI